VGHTLVKKSCRLDRLDFKLDGQLRQVRIDLLQQFADLVLIARLEQSRDGEGGNRAIGVSDQNVQLSLAHRDESGLLAGNAVNDSQGGKFVDWLARVLCKLDQHLEGVFDVDSGTDQVKKFAHRLSCFKLNNIFVFLKARLNISDKSLRRPLIKCLVANQALLDISDELALGDTGGNLALSQLVQELQARHGVLLFQLKQDQQCLILNKAVLIVEHLLLQLAD